MDSNNTFRDDSAAGSYSDANGSLARTLVNAVTCSPWGVPTNEDFEDLEADDMEAHGDQDDEAADLPLVLPESSRALDTASEDESLALPTTPVPPFHFSIIEADDEGRGIVRALPSDRYGSVIPEPLGKRPRNEGNRGEQPNKQQVRRATMIWPRCGFAIATRTRVSRTPTWRKKLEWLFAATSATTSCWPTGPP